MVKTYHIVNIDCANCAARIEDKFNLLPEVEDAVIVFATGQLRLTAEGQITEAELAAAKSAIISGLRSVPDSPRALENFYGTLFLCGHSDDLDARIAAVEAVTIADVARCAATVKLHTVFFLKGELK